MNRAAAWLLIVLSLLMTAIRPARSSDEYIVYSFTMVNVTTEVAQGAIDKVSQYTQMINSAKTMVGGYLGDIAAAAQEKVELAQEKVENAQERVEKVQERIEWAQEQKKALTDKYNELSTKIAEYKQKANDAIQKGMEIRDKYKTYAAKVSEYKDKVTNAINDAKELKDKVENKVNEAKGLAEDKINQAKEQTGMLSNSATTAPQSLKTTSNRAAAIVSAGQLAEKTEAGGISTAEIENLKQGVPLLQQTDVAVEDVMKSAQNIKSSEGEIQSNINLEDQLKTATTKEENKNKADKEKTEIKAMDISSSREVFEAKKEENKDSLQEEMKEIAGKNKGAEK